jgi:hypothetical protein
LANRDDFDKEAKNDLHETLKNLIKNPASLTPGQCSCAMKVYVADKEDSTSDTVMMHCHLIEGHKGSHEHNGHNKSIWHWKG